MSLKDYDYPVVNKRANCNTCNKQKICHQCNECYVMTCTKCILYQFGYPRIPKCNNCNNLFMKGELMDDGGFADKHYNKVIRVIEQETDNHKTLCTVLNKNEKIEIKIKEIFELKERLYNLVFSFRQKLVDEMIENSRISFVDKTLIELYRSCKDITMLDTYNRYLINNDKYPEIVEINNTLFECYIYLHCNLLCRHSIYYDFNIKRLKKKLSKYVVDNKFIYNKDYGEFYEVDKLCRNALKIVNFCNKKDCTIECYKNKKQYCDTNPRLSLCPKCNHYNFKYKNCNQIYCIICANIYDYITLKTESFITNPLCIINGMYTDNFNDKVRSIQYYKYIEKLPEDLLTFIKKNKFTIAKNDDTRDLNICILFSKEIRYSKY